MRSSLSLCPLWALWVQETRFWSTWENSDFWTFRNLATIRASEKRKLNTERNPRKGAHRGRGKLMIEMQTSPVPGSQTHRRSTSHSTQITSAIAFMFLLKWLYRFLGLPCRLSCNKSACSAGDMGSIPESGRCPGEGNGNPLQYSCLGNPWTEEPVGYSPWVHKESDTTYWWNHHHIIVKVIYILL